MNYRLLKKHVEVITMTEAEKRWPDDFTPDSNLSRARDNGARYVFCFHQPKEIESYEIFSVIQPARYMSKNRWLKDLVIGAFNQYPAFRTYFA